MTWTALNVSSVVSDQFLISLVNSSLTSCRLWTESWLVGWSSGQMSLVVVVVVAVFRWTVKLWLRVSGLCDISEDFFFVCFLKLFFLLIDSPWQSLLRVTVIKILTCCFLNGFGDKVTQVTCMKQHKWHHHHHPCDEDYLTETSIWLIWRI